jgi:hypothetical protein
MLLFMVLPAALKPEKGVAVGRAHTKDRPSEIQRAHLRAESAQLRRENQPQN